MRTDFVLDDHFVLIYLLKFEVCFANTTLSYKVLWDQCSDLAIQGHFLRWLLVTDASFCFNFSRTYIFCIAYLTLHTFETTEVLTIYRDQHRLSLEPHGCQTTCPQTRLGVAQGRPFPIFSV